MSLKTKPKIHNYRDYRDYLNDWFRSEKVTNTKMSFRYVAKHLGLSSPNHFQLVITKKRHFSKATATKMTQLLRLPTKEKAYFDWIFLLSFEENPSKRQDIEAKITRLATEIIESTVSYEDYGLLSNSVAWYLKMGALRFDGKTAKEIVSLVKESCPFNIEAKDVEGALELLIKIKGVSLEGDRYVFEINQLKTEWDFDDRKIKQFHYNNLMLAMHTIPWPIKQRFFSNVTIPGNPEVIEVAKKEIRDLCIKLLNMANSQIQTAEECKNITSIQFAMFPYFQFEQDNAKKS